MSVSHIHHDELVPIQPGCFQWLDTATQLLNQVTAYSVHDPDDNFVAWVVLSGEEPPDLTDPNALVPCVETTLITDMCCREELTDELQDEVTATGDMLLRFKADASVMFTQAGGATTPTLGDRVGEVRNLGLTNPMSLIQSTFADRGTLATDGKRLRIEFTGTHHMERLNVPNTTTPGDPFSIAYVFEPTPGAPEHASFLSSPYSNPDNTINSTDALLSGSWQMGRGNGGFSADELIFRYGSAVPTPDIILPYPGGWPAFETSGKHLVFILYDGANIQVFIDGVDYLTTAVTEPLAIEHLGVFRNRQDNAYPNGFFDELIIWSSTLTPAEIQVINEYAICFHEITPPAGTAFIEAEAGFNKFPSIWQKHQQLGQGVVYVNLSTGDLFIPNIAGNVPIPGLGECLGGSCEDCIALDLDSTVRIETGAGSTVSGARAVSLVVLAGPVTIDGIVFPTGTTINFDILFGITYSSMTFDATGGQLAVMETV